MEYHAENSTPFKDGLKKAYKWFIIKKLNCSFINDYMKNVIWMKTPKCGGTSMLRHLTSRAKTHVQHQHFQILTFENCRVFVLQGAWSEPDEYRPIEVFKSEYLKIFANSWKFIFVRNPWDRLLSAYLYERAPIGLATGGFNKDEFLKFLMRSDLQSWLRTPHKRPLYDRWMDKNNLCDYFDFVGRFEDLQKDYDFVCEQIGLPHSRLPHCLQTTHLPYWKYYNDEMQKIVAHHYKKDIEHFGYKFRDVR